MMKVEVKRFLVVGEKNTVNICAKDVVQAAGIFCETFSEDWIVRIWNVRKRVKTFRSI